MLKGQIRVGAVYRMKVGVNITDVRITSTGYPRGWVGVNLRTGREVRVRSAAKLRTEVQAAPASAVDYKSRAAGERDGE